MKLFSKIIFFIIIFSVILPLYIEAGEIPDYPLKKVEGGILNSKAIFKEGYRVLIVNDMNCRYCMDTLNKMEKFIDKVKKGRIVVINIRGSEKDIKNYLSGHQKLKRMLWLIDDNSKFTRKMNVSITPSFYGIKDSMEIGWQHIGSPEDIVIIENLILSWLKRR